MRFFNVQETGDWFFDICITAAPWLIVVTFCWEYFFIAEYGKFTKKNTLTVNPRFGWWLLEIPCTLTFAWNFSGPLLQAESQLPKLLGCLFLMQYLYRGWIFPYLIRTHKNSAG